MSEILTMIESVDRPEGTPPENQNNMKRKASGTDCDLSKKRLAIGYAGSSSEEWSEVSDSSMSDVKEIESSQTPTFYGLPLKIIELLKKYRNINQLYDWQTRLMAHLVSNNKNVIYSVPTSGGKTLVAELMIIRELLVNRKNALLVLPFVSIVQEKLRSMYPFAEKLNFMIEEFAGSKGHLPLKSRKKMKTLYVATIEKANLVVMSMIETGKLHELGMVVIDELHMVGEGSGRGATLETLIVKLKLAAKRLNPSLRMLGMSATLSNFNELAKFMDAEVVKDEFRPVELKEYIKLEDFMYDATGLAKKGLRYEDMPIVRTFPPKNKDSDDLITLVEEMIPEKSCLVFCSTKKHCETLALFLTKALFQRKPLRRHKTAEKSRAILSIKASNDGSICPVLLQTIPSGIAYHHSGLTPDEREIIESAFLKGTISCIVCTSTLAAGVNLPAERVIIREPKVGLEFLSKSQYKQMCGRAGRAGMTSFGESILMVTKYDNHKAKELVESSLAPCRSSLLDLQNGISTLLLNLLFAGLTNSVDDLIQIMKEVTFAGQQYKHEVIEEQTNLALKKLMSKNLIVENKQILSITTDGRGVVKSLIDVDRCSNIYEQLIASTTALSVSNHLHLIFVATSLFEEGELLHTIDTWLLFDCYMDLTASEKTSAKVMGIDEQAINRARDTGRADWMLKRFFVTLIVYDAYKNRLDVDALSRKFSMQRGNVFALLNQVSGHAASLFRFVEEKKENLWAFVNLLPDFCSRLTYCCNPELLPLVQLPGVKLTRAKQLLQAGFRDVVSIAKSNDHELVKKVNNLNTFQARKIIKAARHQVKAARDELEEQVKNLNFDESFDSIIDQDISK